MPVGPAQERARTWIEPPPPGIGARTKAAGARVLFARWPAAPEPVEGYSLLLPVPADLPVFLDLALANAAAQEPSDRVEALVIPDAPSRAFAAQYDRASSREGIGASRLVSPGRRGAVMRRSGHNEVSSNHFIQLQAGIGAARGTHVLIHDADLFMDDPAFMSAHYRSCVERSLACLGVSPVHDGWFRERGLEHVVATWEMMASTEWLRSFPPWHHRPRVDVLDGEWHVFDTLLLTQARTDPQRIALQPASEGWEHFNWVIGRYRGFQRASGNPTEDHRFVLLLIRLLSDEFGAPAGIVPTVDELARGLAGRGPVTYTGEATPGLWPQFVRKLERALAGPAFPPGAADRVMARLGPWERAFG
jgi:hypothetical protein